VADEVPAASTEDLDKPPADMAGLARKWCAEIAASQKQQAKWEARAKKVEKIYNDERDITADRSRKFNILWSNVETLRPAVYMNTPKARAVRRYHDRDPIARLASMLLERCLETSCELYDFDNQIDQAVRDRLLPGRGQVWVFYEPQIVGGHLAYEDVTAEYVPWLDFLHSVCRTWNENRWVARAFYKTRSEIGAWLQQLELDPSVAAKLTMDVSNEGDKSQEGLKDERSKCKIWEVWDKDSRQVIYVAPGSDEDAIIGMRPPPVKFRDFWPCPRPLLATTTSKSLIPTPDYALYQDQAEELNRCSERIGVLQKALKVVGIYASESAELATMLEASDNRMIAVKNWAMFAEGGGAKGRVEFFPVEIVMEVLKGLYEVRDQAKQTLYEVSGIGDILRGSTDPNETATAQGIKAKWGSLRVRRIQKDVMRFAADIMRLKAEVISEQFQFRTIAQMAGLDAELIAKYVPQPPPPQAPPAQAGPPQQQQPGQPPNPVAAMQAQAQQALQAQAAQQQQQQMVAQFLAQVEKLLRDDASRNFRIDVETDSTLEPDMQEEKQVATEFMTAMVQFMEAAAPMASSSPEAAKLVGELLLFGVRRFDKVDQLEQVIEQAVEAAAKPKGPPPPDPEMMKVQAEVERAKGDLALKGQELQANAVTAQSEQALKGQELQLKAGETAQNAEIEKMRFELDKQKLRIDALLKAKELEIKQRELDLRGQEINDRSAIEHHKIDAAGAMKDKELQHQASESSKAAAAEAEAEAPPEPKEDKSGEAIGEGLKAIGEGLKYLARPKTVKRGKDGKVEGFE